MANLFAPIRYNLSRYQQKILSALIFSCLFAHHTMKNYLLFLPLLTVLTGCGQVGPLYLPNGPAPIYVPKAKPEPEQKTPTKTQSEPEKTK